MYFRGFVSFFFKGTRRWEFKLVAARIVIIAIATGCLYLLLNSGFKQYAYPLAWLLFVVVIASIGYQFVRRWRDFKANRDKATRH
jgi:hypothetical protein